MRINYNVSAAIANKRLLGIENNMSTAMERLSSGLKLNHAKDNPAGMAISNRMQAQINGLDRASQNASDGISVIQISDGALSEVTSILQRMRELSVQAANDATMSLTDKQAIQSEIDSLKDEIDRISTDTEYNTKTLLDGSLDTRVYTEHASRVQISDQLEAGEYGITIDTAAQRAEISNFTNINFNDTTTQIGVGGSISFNGCSVEIEETDTYAEVYEKLRDTAEIGEVIADRDSLTGKLELKSLLYGTEGVIRMEFDNNKLAAAMGISANDIQWDKDSESYVYGTANGDVVEVPEGKDMTYSALSGFGSSATAAVDGNKVTITDIGGKSLSFLVDEGYERNAPKLDINGNPVLDANGNAVTYDGSLKFEVTDIGTMMIHIGANTNQNMSVRIPEVSSESLYIDDVDVTTVKGADRAITSFDNAIAQVSSVRSGLGACQNRLEYSVNSLDEFEENMTSALSRLTDADMADEMTEYTHQSVLNQAAISVLTQANDIPQQILQILS